MIPINRTSYRAALALFIVLVLPFTKRFFNAWGLRWAYIFSLAFTISYLLTPAIRAAAAALNVLDRPGPRKIHTHPTPLLGGISIYAAFVFSVFANFIFTTQVIAILIASTLVMAIGMIDDTTGVGVPIKLTVQLSATAIVMASGVWLILLPRAWFGSWVVNGFLTILWIVGITNAMNFIDGMDGLASGLAVIISFFLGLLAFQTHQPFLGWLTIAILGGSLGFLPYNFRRGGPATIFLGDTGSTFLGFTLACLAVLGEWSKHNPVVSIAAPLLIFGVLIFDMAHTTVARFHTGKVSSIQEWLGYKGGTDHMHHRLAEVLLTPRQSVLFILLLASCLGLASTVLRNAQTRDALLLIVQAVVILLLVTILENVGRWKLRAKKPTRPAKPPDKEKPPQTDATEKETP